MEYVPRILQLSKNISRPTYKIYIVIFLADIFLSWGRDKIT